MTHSSSLIALGRTMFGVALIGLGILCIVNQDFMIGRPTPWLDGTQSTPAFGYVTGILVLLAGAAIAINFITSWAALLVAFMIVVFSLSRHFINYIDWLNSLKAISLLGCSLAISAIYFNDEKRERLRDTVLYVSCLMMSGFFIAAGYAHFIFASFVAEQLIPAYIPLRLFLTYFTGVCLFAGGIGLLIPMTRRWAALLSAFMITGWFVLLHIPRFVSDMNNGSDRLGLFESFGFAGVYFLLAGWYGRVK